jgi:Txe/YoeB family toxin of Txe-Axe toxin-antitoxin module
VGQRSLIMMGRFVDDLLAWSRSDPRMVIRILELVQSIGRDPKHGSASRNG